MAAYLQGSPEWTRVVRTESVVSEQHLTVLVEPQLCWAEGIATQQPRKHMEAHQKGIQRQDVLTVYNFIVFVYFVCKFAAGEVYGVYGLL